jgi:hypothetical protein
VNIKTIIALLFLVLAVLDLAPAQTDPAPEPRPAPERFVYQWTDNNGVVHMTDDPGQVPKKYLNKSLKKKAEPQAEESQERPQGEAVKTAPESTSSDLEFEQRLRRDEWQQRYLDWKDKLRRSAQQLQSLQQRRADLIAQWGSPAVAPPAVREEVGQVDKSLKDTQAEIDEARHMIEEVLPDEARRAGVPPGWQRE